MSSFYSLVTQCSAAANMFPIAMSGIRSCRSLLCYLPFVWTITKVVAFSASAATFAVIYAEGLFQLTKYLYRRGVLKRYGPLPGDRNMISNWSNAFGFIIPSVAYVHFFSSAHWHWRSPGIAKLYVYTLLYMLLHDTLFYLLHRLFHSLKSVYGCLHAKHHEYSKAMNVYVVGYAEITENIIQVGIPWVMWTAVAGRGSILNAIVPFSVTLFTTLLGHSGSKMHPYLLFYHPWAALILIPFGRHMLTPGHHQMHHVFRRCNFGLFFRHCDKLSGTYRSTSISSHDVSWWNRESPDSHDDRFGKESRQPGVEVSFGF